MTPIQYLISSPSRTGTINMQAMLMCAGVKVLVSHSPYIDIDYKNTCLIILERHNRFAAIMSQIMADCTKEYHNYTNLVIEPFGVPCSGKQSYFAHKNRWNKWYTRRHDLSLPWDRVENFYFEEFLNNPEYVYSRLGLTALIDFIPTVKCPYNAQDFVINYDECRATFDRLQEYDVMFDPTNEYETTYTNTKPLEIIVPDPEMSTDH